MLADCLVRQSVETTPCDIGLELTIPALRVKFKKPVTESRELIGWKVRNRFFEFLQFHVVIVAGNCGSRQLRPPSGDLGASFAEL